MRASWLDHRSGRRAREHGNVVERQLQATGIPLEPARLPNACVRVRSSPRAVACPSTSRRMRASTIELARADQTPAEHDTWALAVFERETQPLLDLHAALEQARRELARPPLGRRHVPDRDREQALDRRPARPCRAPLGVGRAPARTSPRSGGPPAVAQDPRLTHVVVRRLGQRLVAKLDDRRRVPPEASRPARRGRRSARHREEPP